MRLQARAGLLALLVLALALSGAGSCRRPAASCSECGRSECGNLTFTLRFQGGEEVSTCCARCGLHSLASRGGAAASMSVRDFDTARTLDAAGATFVEGSDMTPCASMDPSTPKDERGCCMTPVYDRCLPSLLAFGSRERAETFAREHGGVLKTLANLRAPGAQSGRGVPSGS